MFITLIAAVSDNHIIGREGQLPWHLPADLKHFKTLTLGKPLLMGRKTFESIGKPLPGRHTIIITRNPDYAVKNCLIAHSLEKGIALAKKHHPQATDCMIAGGGHIYEQALPLANKMYLTQVHININGDTYFPAWSSKNWKAHARTTHPAKENAPSYTFLTLQRIQ